MSLKRLSTVVTKHSLQDDYFSDTFRHAFLKLDGSVHAIANTRLEVVDGS